MSRLTATELADRLELSKARISQYVSEGKLEGCYTGEGRARRFDPNKVAERLGRTLHLGQMTGNGLNTRRNLRQMADSNADEPIARRSDSEMDARDPDRLELATIQIKEEEARRRRRENAREEGLWILAEEVERQTARALAAEIGQFDAVIREAARQVADTFGLDYRQVRKLMMDQWRAHRTRRAAQLGEDADAAPMSAAEIGGQV